MPADVVLYSRPYCGLCEDAAAELQSLSSDFGFMFSERNIDDDPLLRAQYDAVVPVVVVDGRIVAQAPFLVEELRDLISEALAALN